MWKVSTTLDSSLIKRFFTHGVKWHFECDEIRALNDVPDSFVVKPSVWKLSSHDLSENFEKNESCTRITIYKQTY
jgi:hypothetical protein